MSDTKELATENTQNTVFEPVSSDVEKLEITIRNDTNEVILRNPKDGRVVRLQAELAEAIKERIEEEEEEEDKPLTPEEFEEALRKIDALGFKFTAELFPSIVSKDETANEIVSDELEELEEKYPTLLRELGIVIYNVLTDESRVGIDSIGGLESFEKKAQIVRQVVITDDFRKEFFFKNSLKVPYLESIDWEVILKTHERGVNGIVNVPYALLMLTFHNTNPRVGRLDIHKNITTAVNLAIIEKMLATLTKVKVSLEASEKMRDILNNDKSLTE